MPPQYETNKHTAAQSVVGDWSSGTQDSDSEMERYYTAIRELANTKNFKGTFALPNNYLDILSDCNQSANVSRALICYYVILQTYKNHTRRNRNGKDSEEASDGETAADTRKRKHETDDDDEDEDKEAKTKKSKSEIAIAIKSNCNHVPDKTHDYTSLTARIATYLFCLREKNDASVIPGLSAIVNNQYKTVSDILELCRTPPTDLKRILSETKACNLDKLNIMQSILRIGDLLHDRTLSYVFMHYSYEKYKVYCSTAVAKNVYGTSHPYWALIQLYLKTCVLRFEQRTTQQSLIRQFKINPAESLNHVMSQLDRKEQAERAQREQGTGKAYKFDPEQMYTVYESDKPFSSRIVTSSLKCDGKVYSVQTYDNCLFNVLGTETESFMNMSWMDRLEAINVQMPRIVLKNRQGDKLNRINRTAYMAVSWMNDGAFNMICVKKQPKRDNKIANE